MPHKWYASNTLALQGRRTTAAAHGPREKTRGSIKIHRATPHGSLQCVA